MMKFYEIKERVMSGYMTYDELVNIHDKFMGEVDSILWGPERYERELELRDIEDWMLDLRFF